MACYKIVMLAQQRRRWTIRPYIAVIAMAVVVPRLVWATAIVAVMDPPHHRIIFGADGLFVPYELKPSATGIRKRESHCKIIVTSGCVGAVAGIDQYGTFSLDKMLRRSCEKAGDLRSKANYFAEEGREGVYEFSQWAKQNAQSFFQERIASGGHNIAEAVFAGIQDRQLSLFGRGIFRDSKGAFDVRVHDQTQGATMTHAVLGVAPIAGFNWRRGNAIDIARNYLMLATKTYPDTVGLPISILEIGQNMTRPDQFAINWIERGACDQ